MGCGASAGSNKYQSSDVDAVSSTALGECSDVSVKSSSSTNVRKDSEEISPPVTQAPELSTDFVSTGSLSSSVTLTVSDYIVQRLVDCGVTHVFGGHGGAVVPLIDSICAHPKITWIYMRCELNASIAAAAFAKLRNGLACCVGTSGPGSSHLTTGLLDAELDRCSVLCLTGMKNTKSVGYSDFQDINQTELFRAAGISYSKSIIHKGGVVPLLRDAIANSLTNSACAHLALPFNIQKKEIQAPKKFLHHDDVMHNDRLLKHPDSYDAACCARWLKSALVDGHRCLIAVGHRAVEYGEQIQALAEILGLPIVTTQDAKGTVPENHPCVVECLAFSAILAWRHLQNLWKQPISFCRLASTGITNLSVHPLVCRPAT
jgi:thiamine pyrophosphate-dependent acetolactate synthase large subunit-like protein